MFVLSGVIPVVMGCGSIIDTAKNTTGQIEAVDMPPGTEECIWEFLVEEVSIIAIALLVYE